MICWPGPPCRSQPPRGTTPGPPSTYGSRRALYITGTQLPWTDGFSQSRKLSAPGLSVVADRLRPWWSLHPLAWNLLSAGRVTRLIDSDLNARLIIRQRAPRSTRLTLRREVNGCSFWSIARWIRYRAFQQRSFAFHWVVWCTRLSCFAWSSSWLDFTKLNILMRTFWRVGETFFVLTGFSILGETLWDYDDAGDVDSLRVVEKLGILGRIKVAGRKLLVLRGLFIFHRTLWYRIDFRYDFLASF